MKKYVYVYVRIKFSSVRAYAIREKANRERERKKKRKKCKGKGSGWSLSFFLFQCSLTESNPSNIFSVFFLILLLFDIDSKHMRTHRRKKTQAENASHVA